MESMPKHKPARTLRRLAEAGALALSLMACSSRFGLEGEPQAEFEPGPGAVVPALLSPEQAQARATQEVSNAQGGKFETPDQYGQFPVTQQATGPYKVLARNPYFDENNAAVTEVPLVANEASSAVYPIENGVVSHYSYDFPKRLASGQPYKDTEMTAAHKKLPFGTIVRCTRTDTGQAVVVVINDRGPYIRGRVLDLSEGAAKKIGLKGCGVAPCKIEVLAYPLVETTGPRGNG